MSSNDEDYGEQSHRGKKRRLAPFRYPIPCEGGATTAAIEQPHPFSERPFFRLATGFARWDGRCDGSQVPGDKCTTCSDANLDCTYLETTAVRFLLGLLIIFTDECFALKKRPPPKSYVDSLEARLEHSEALVRQLRAELASTHFSKSSSASPSTSSPASHSPADIPNGDKSASASTSAPISGTKPLDGSTASLYIMRTALRSLAAPPPPPNADDLEHLEIARKVPRETLLVPMREHFIGKSSGAALVKAAIDLKADVKREEKMGRSPEGSVDDQIGSEGREEDGDPWTSRRMQYWQWNPGRTPRAAPTRSSSLPGAHEPLHRLVLHAPEHLPPAPPRPTFERSVADGLHLRDDGFAATLLLVCAISSRWSTSPTVAGSGLARGWEWFDQVPLVFPPVASLAGGNVPRRLFGAASLLDPRRRRTAPSTGHWRTSTQSTRRSATVESELYKRAFWVLVYLDRIISSGMGRTCAVQYDDFDIDPPIECDDDSGSIRRVSFFNTLMRLNHILSFSLKILYSLNKVRVFFSVNDAWEESAVAELDSSLNHWRDRIPEHLRWNPTRKDQVFFDQSVALHCAYYHLQILIHRPFIPMLRKSAPTALPSLAICTSAARACANIVDVQRQRNGNVPGVINLPAVFTSAIVLLLNVWSGKRTGLVPDPSREMANVHKCMEVVRLCEDRWQAAGLFWDILAELASVGQLPLPDLNGGSGSIRTSNGIHHHQNGAAGVNYGDACILPPVRGTRYPGSCHSEPLDEEATSHISLGARGLRQAPTFTPDMHGQFRSAPYVHSSSFAGQIGSEAGTFGPAPMEPSAFAPTPAPETWFPPQDPFTEVYTDPAQASRELGDMMNLIDSDTIAMWTNAPMGLEVDDWGTYFSNFSEITQGQQMSHGDMGGMNGH
ncbi:hypothetical protein K438DRAFT_2021624 [Mycena galopus ATCC 62051]|nr:hypothetical protein K438DRAFT_2021624 [Mycena galopus ATCC 62051]